MFSVIGTRVLSINWQVLNLVIFKKFTKLKTFSAKVSCSMVYAWGYAHFMILLLMLFTSCR